MKSEKNIKVKYEVLFINKLKAIEYILRFSLLFIYYIFSYPSF